MADVGDGLRFAAGLLDAPTSAASLCSWSIHHRHGAGDAAQSDLRDFCNRPPSALSAIASLSRPHRPPPSRPARAPSGQFENRRGTHSRCRNGALASHLRARARCLRPDAVKELTAGNRSTRGSAAAIVRNLMPRSGHVPIDKAWSRPLRPLPRLQTNLSLPSR